MRLAVVSPFLDKRHGTERCIAEQAERLARDHGFEVHIYAQRLDDLEGVQTAESWRGSSQGKASGSFPPGALVWHKVVDFPGPHLLKYVGWFLSNQLLRWWDRRRGLRFDLVYTPGVNCFDACVISVHVVFARLLRRLEEELVFRRGQPGDWPRVAHRRLYYRLLAGLEQRLYARRDKILSAVSRKVAGNLREFFDREDVQSIVYHGVDLEQFNPQRRAALRPLSRRSLGLPESAFVLLLVGNDFRTKGLRYLLEAAARAGLADARVLVVGEDDPLPYRALLAEFEGGVQFLPLRRDVEFYFAAADAYVGPSLEDSFGLPPAEAMACGLPVIVSRRAGVSEIVTHGRDGFILEDPADVVKLAGWIQELCHNHSLRREMGEQAARTAAQYTWSRNADQIKQVLDRALASARGR